MANKNLTNRKTAYTHDGEKRILPPSAGAVKNQHVKGEKKSYNTALIKGGKTSDHVEKEVLENITPPPRSPDMDSRSLKTRTKILNLNGIGNRIPMNLK